MSVDTICCFCHSAEEDTLHLFFRCPYVHMLWRSTINLTAGRNVSNISEVEWDLIYKATRWKSVTTFTLLFTLKVFISIIWDERNAIIFKAKRKTVMQMKESIKCALKSGIVASRIAFDPGFLDALS